MATQNDLPNWDSIKTLVYSTEVIKIQIAIIGVAHSNFENMVIENYGDINKLNNNNNKLVQWVFSSKTS